MQLAIGGGGDEACATMASSTEELAAGYAEMLANFPAAPPLTLMNHGVEEATVVIAAIIDVCAERRLGLKQLVIGTELSEELGLAEGSRLKHGERPQVAVDPTMGRQIRFIVQPEKSLGVPGLHSG